MCFGPGSLGDVAEPRLEFQHEEVLTPSYLFSPQARRAHRMPRQWSSVHRGTHAHSAGPTCAPAPDLRPRRVRLRAGHHTTTTRSATRPSRSPTVCETLLRASTTPTSPTCLQRVAVAAAAKRCKPSRPWACQRITGARIACTRSMAARAWWTRTTPHGALRTSHPGRRSVLPLIANSSNVRRLCLSATFAL